LESKCEALGENNSYNKTKIVGGGSALPAGFKGPGFAQQSNNLLTVLPQNARLPTPMRLPVFSRIG
jgi:hypothetical protein